MKNRCELLEARCSALQAMLEDALDERDTFANVIEELSIKMIKLEGRFRDQTQVMRDMISKVYVGGQHGNDLSKCGQGSNCRG